MGLAFPSPKSGAAASSKAAAKNGGYESPINGVVSDDEDDDGGVDTDSTDDDDDEGGEGKEETEARVEISRPAMTQSRMQERFQFSRLPITTKPIGCRNLQGTVLLDFDVGSFSFSNERERKELIF